MYTEENNMMPREAIGDELLLRMLDNTRPCCNLPSNGGCGNANTDSVCKPSKTFGLEGYPLASMYAPLQEFRNLYDKETALREGPLFSELNLPCMGASVTKGGCQHD